MSSTEDFTQVSQAFVNVVEQIRDDQWGLPGLGNWDVRALTGHTARALLTVENYLALDEPGHDSIGTAENYYGTIYAEYTDPQSIEDRGVEAGIWLGEDAVGAVTEARSRALASIDAQQPDRLVSLGGLGITLTEYLRTRVFELVTHTLDISRATGIPANIESGPMLHTVLLAAQIAADSGRGPELLLALTGRSPLPEGFNVV